VVSTFRLEYLSLVHFLKFGSQINNLIYNILLFLDDKGSSLLRIDIACFVLFFVFVFFVYTNVEEGAEFKLGLSLDRDRTVSLNHKALDHVAYHLKN
jgi:hypothetical protein